MEFFSRCLPIEFTPVAAHLRGMRPAPTSQKDTLMLREKLKFQN